MLKGKEGSFRLCEEMVNEFDEGIIGVRGGMILMNITIILLYLFSFLLIWQFAGYPSLMAIAALKLKSKPKDKDYSYQQTVLTKKVLSKKQGFLLAQTFSFKL
ncbi:MAG: hypothetical protein U9N41_05660 [Euryarchaeota archaeon]|nr:hypothetical protein [Euryarchaeota archaeon]